MLSSAGYKTAGFLRDFSRKSHRSLTVDSVQTGVVCGFCPNLWLDSSRIKSNFLTSGQNLASVINSSAPLLPVNSMRSRDAYPCVYTYIYTCKMKERNWLHFNSTFVSWRRIQVSIDSDSDLVWNRQESWLNHYDPNSLTMPHHRTFYLDTFCPYVPKTYVT